LQQQAFYVVFNPNSNQKPSHVTDSLLIEKCKQQDRKAQMELYRKYCDGMFIVANRYMKDVAVAEDALQEAFIKAFQKINQFKGDVTFGAWLKRIVINRCLDIIKSRKMELQSLDEGIMHIAEDDTDWQIADEATMEEVYHAIEQLPDHYKVVVKLYLLEGYDHQEISEILDISESASRTNLHRGKLQLKKTLKHLEYGTGY
jgi:RNA polymerase sigma-70 factor (ECF subfamily)